MEETTEERRKRLRREANARHYKANREKLNEASRKAQAVRRATPEGRAKHNEANRKCFAAARATPEGRAKHNESNRKVKSSDEGKAYNREYMNKRLAEDSQFKLAHNQRKRIWTALKAANSGKTCRSPELLGCSIEHLMQHLEAQFVDGMTWENQGLGGWDVDHIRPLASFDLTDPEQAKQAFNWANCRPMWGADNRSKGSLHEGQRHRYAL